MRGNNTSVPNKNPLSVLFYYEGAERYARPVRLEWHGREYDLGAVQFWYTTRHDGRLTHHYTVGDTANYYVFTLAFDTEELDWTLTKLQTTADAAPQPRPSWPRLVGAIS